MRFEDNWLPRSTPTMELARKVCNEIRRGCTFEIACGLHRVLPQTWIRWWELAKQGAEPHVTFFREVKQSLEHYRRSLKKLVDGPDDDGRFRWMYKRRFTNPLTDEELFGEASKPDLTIQGDDENTPARL